MDAPALAPGPASGRGGFDGAVPAPGAAQAKPQSLRQASTDPGGATAPASSPRTMGTLKERARQMSLGDLRRAAGYRASGEDQDACSAAAGG